MNLKNEKIIEVFLSPLSTALYQDELQTNPILRENREVNLLLIFLSSIQLR